MQSWIQKTRKIICLLRNYEAHAAEMKSAPPTSVDFFIKPTTSILLHRSEQPYAAIEIPSFTGSDVHHEIELGVVIGSDGKNISEENAFDHVAGFFLGLDMTARKLQAQAKQSGRPWTAAKGFDTFCPIGDEFIARDELYDVSTGRFRDVNLSLKVNGQVKQYGNTKDMIFSIPQCISAISKVMTLQEGDFILTGTPEGVGPVNAGDLVEAEIEGVTKIYRFEVKNI